MTLRFMDGFDHYNDTQGLVSRGWNVSWSGITNNPRTGTNAMYCRQFAGAAYAIAPIQTPKSTWIVGFAYQDNSVGVAKYILRTNDGVSGDMVQLYLNTDGSISIHRNGTFLAGPTTQRLSTNVYDYIELKFFISDTVGTVELRLNGITVLSATGLDTKAFATATVNTFVFGNSTSSAQYQYFDDIYICDSDGTVNNDFLGDVKIVALYPSGAGAHTQFTPSTGANYAAVDESTPNDDTDYVADSNIGDYDTYAFADIPGTATVKAIMTIMRAKKDDAGARTICPVIRQSGTDGDGATVILSTSYQTFEQMYEVNPVGGAAWTQAEVNAAEFGVKVVA